MRRPRARPRARARSSASRSVRRDAEQRDDAAERGAERIVPSRFWRSGTACEPTMIRRRPPRRRAARSSGATTRTSARRCPTSRARRPRRPCRADRGAEVVVAADGEHGAAAPAQRVAGVAERRARERRPGSSRAARPDHATVSSHHPRECRSSNRCGRRATARRPAHRRAGARPTRRRSASARRAPPRARRRAASGTS